MDTKVVKDHSSNAKARCFSIFDFLPIPFTNSKLPAQLLGRYPDRTVSVTLAQHQFAVLMSAEALKC